MLSELYKDFDQTSCSGCQGCSILNSKKAVKAHMDYGELGKNDVLFITDSFRYSNGKILSLSDQERKVLASSCPVGFAMSPSVKCSDVKEADMSPANMDICRKHLSDTIDAVKPKIVFACGNLPLKMLLKKSGIKDKRGNVYEYVSNSGFKCSVMPTIHPYMAIVEPRYLEILKSDVRAGVSKAVYGEGSTYGFSYEVIDTIEALEKLDFLLDTDETIAFDLETTGLSFLKERITMLAIATSGKTYAIPLEHKDAPWGDNLPIVVEKLKKVFENPKNIKVGHNVKFDVKHLKNLKIRVANPYDTKIMGKLIDENSSNSLRELVKTHFPLYKVEDVRS